jgi:hypothetical protein
MATSNNVKNLNTLNPLGFEFVLTRSPNLVWFIQGVNVPGVSSSSIESSYSVGKAQFADNKLEYNELTITFLVDESLNGWREIYNWMRGLAPTSIGDDVTNQYSSLMNTDFSLVSDGTLIIHTNASNPNIKFNFKDLFPVTLSDIEMNLSSGDVESIQSTVTFRYTRYDIEVSTPQEQNAIEGNTF